MDRFAVEPRPFAIPGGIKLVGDRIVYNPEHRPPADHQPQGNAPQGNTGDEIAGAVDRVDDPYGIPAGVLAATLLAQYGVLWKCLEQTRHEECLAGLVRFADEVLLALALDLQLVAAAKEIRCRLAGLTHQALGKMKA